jgi:2-(3-amino-3-carboxypropyl)histidine synthase
MKSPAEGADDAPKRFFGTSNLTPEASHIFRSASSNEIVSIPATASAAAAPRVAKRIIGQQVPPEILENQALNNAIAILPANYNFEVHKTVWRIRQVNACRVALQFPEGLLLYSCVISDILESFAGVEETFIMGDVAFGACCVDDYSASALDADFLVHYGHSCLIPVSITSIPCMYVFVDIKMDTEHFISCVRTNFSPKSRLILAGTIQFAASMQLARTALLTDYPEITVPQSKPLSPGEVLGCTAPVVPGEYDAIVFVADGRFHLEALMIANPRVKAYRYDPYGRMLTVEKYDQQGMRIARKNAVEKARKADTWGIVLGTLGRQGNPHILNKVVCILENQNKKYVVVLLSEISPMKLKEMAKNGAVQAWIQIACPRLSIDWGEEFQLPTLNPYEAFIALNQVPGWWEEGSSDYPMDYYSQEGGKYNSSYHKKKEGQERGVGMAAIAQARVRKAAERVIETTTTNAAVC